MADTLGGLFISEILADNAGGSAVDVDGDGNTNKADEFIELQNNSGAAISLDGYEVWSEKQGELYSFGPDDTIADGETATIVGNYTGTPPAGFYSGGVSENANFIPDGEGQKFDSIFLVDTATGEYVVLSYGNPPRTPTLPSGFPGTTQVGGGETIDSNAPNGTAFVRDANGDFVEGTPNPGDPGVPCFAKGTRIRTARGDIAVEHLRTGMLIQTRDSEMAELKAVRSVHLDNPRSCDRPVLFPTGVIGNRRPLALSQSHRFALSANAAQLMFAAPEVLIPAAQAVGHGGIALCPDTRPVTYFHLLLERHELIQAEGCWAESLFLGDVAKRAIWSIRTWNIMTGFNIKTARHPATVRPVLKGYESDVLLSMYFGKDRQPDVRAA